VFAPQRSEKRFGLSRAGVTAATVRRWLRKAGYDAIQGLALALLFVGIMTLSGCEHGDLVPRDMRSLLIPRFQRSEVLGFVAGLGTTFAAVPDLIAMFKRRSSVGMNLRMTAILAIFQVLWIYYGLLIASRPVIAWNMIAVLINSLSVAAYYHFARKDNPGKSAVAQASQRS
jgi:MtN3 and saliva related transmembrane protein